MLTKKGGEFVSGNLKHLFSTLEAADHHPSTMVLRKSCGLMPGFVSQPSKFKYTGMTTSKYDPAKSTKITAM